MELIIADMNSYLKQLSNQERDVFALSKKASIFLSESLTRFNSLTMKKFKSDAEEILFFKTLKPQLFSNLYYYTRLYHIQIKTPPGSDKSIKDFLHSELYKIDKHYEENKDIYSYYKTEASDLDQQYFKRVLRQQASVPIDDDWSYNSNLLTAVHDETFARIIANIKLTSYLKQSLQNLKQNNHVPENMLQQSTEINRSPFQWTEGNTAFVEFVLCQKSLINNGNISTSELLEILCNIYNIKITYRELQKVKYRLKGRGKSSILIEKMKSCYDDELHNDEDLEM